MNKRPSTGEKVLLRPASSAAYNRFQARPVRTLNDYQMMVTLRAMTFMSEQHCPYDEEFDENDLCATNFLVFDGHRPVGTLRLRWFAEFAKLERIALLASYRGTGAVKVLLAEAFEVVARKGYVRMISHIQRRYWDLWSNTFNFTRVPNKPSFFFSDYEYYEIEIPVPIHPKRITLKADPYLILRPEGSWDEPGVLEASAGRNIDEQVAA